MTHYRRNALIALLFLILTSPVYATLVGETPANFQVSPSGAATYSVPIQVPPGINGMQPNLSLNYNSQAGNGLLGLGWNIGGLSAITRCPATQVQDGFKGGMNFNNKDRFCLDGQRLLAVSGAYGSNGTEYRTAINNFSEIKSYGTAGNGPEYFIIRTKSGQTMEYATTPDSKIEAQGRNDVLIWALAKVKDRNGNYLIISYAEDNTNGESYPTEIHYTGNTNQSTGPGNRVQFEYENRPNTIHRYIGGSAADTSKHLVGISIFSGSSLAKKYNLSYATVGLTGDTQLSSIEECVPTDECLPPVIFTWNDTTTLTFSGPQKGPATYIDKTSADSINLSMDRIRFGDFNGDGITDIYRINGGETYGYVPGTLGLQKYTTITSSKPDTVYLSNEDGTYTPHNTGPNTTVSGGFAEATRVSLNAIKFGDFDGDGRTDIYSRGSYEKVYLSNGDGTFRERNATGLSTYIYTGGSSFSNQNERIMLGDFNGDGRTDIYRINGGEFPEKCEYSGPFNLRFTCTPADPNNKPDTIWFSNGDGTFTRHVGTNGPDTRVDGNGTNKYLSASSLRRVKLGDFNGDGMTDIYYINGSGNDAADTIYLSNGNGSFVRKNTGPRTYVRGGGIEHINFSLGSIRFGDFNGDGLTDVYQIKDWNHYGDDQVYLSKGDGTFAQLNSGFDPYIDGQNLKNANAWASRIKFGDFNGDGLTDIYHVTVYGGTSTDYVYLSKANGTFDSGHPAASTYINRANIDKTISSLKRVNLGDFNGDGLTDVYYINGLETSSADTLQLSKTQKPFISEISNPLSTKININYAPITDNGIYTKGTSATYPEQDIQAPIYVTTLVKHDDGVGGQTQSRYRYAGLKLDLSGRGNLGFSFIQKLDINNDLKTYTFFRQDYPYIGSPRRQEKRVISNNRIISNTDTEYASTGSINATVAPYASRISDISYDLNSSQILTTTIITSTQDIYGNPVTTTKNISGNGETFLEVTTNTYEPPDTTNWCLSKTSLSDVHLEGTNSSYTDRVTTFGWDYTKCRLTQSTVLPGEGDSLEMTTAYTYDPFGNRITKTVSGPVDTARTTKTDFASNSTTYSYPDGQFATRVTNALGHSETREYDARFGLVTKLTGPNGISTCFEYDELGRQILERQYCGTPSETTTTTSYAWCDTTCPQYASYMIRTQQTGRAPVTVYYDKLNREIRTSRVGFSDNQIFVDTKYNNLGRLAAISEPYFEGDPSYWSEYIKYDVLGRVEIFSPLNTNQKVTTEYDGFTTKVTDVLGRQRSKTKDAMGKIRSVTDALGNAITYQYDAAGNLTTTTDSVGNVITLTYDKRNRKIAMSDPDMGNWSYTYNTFGELLTQTDAKTQVTKMTYDALGRITSRTALEGTSTWSYDSTTNGKGIGKLARMDSAGGNAREFSYDPVGRLDQIIDHIDMQAFTSSRTYDYASRIDTITYPTNFVVQQVYKFNGYMEKVQSTDGTTIYWQANSLNARGQLLDSTLGNGVHTSRSYNTATGWLNGIYTFNRAMTTVQLNTYSFNEVGDLMTRSDQRQGLTESFTYDDLDRVLTADIAGGAGTYVPRTYSYDALGNITTKSDVGSYIYGQNSAGPRAVTQAGTRNYTYDANGNMTSGDGRTINYTSFNKPNTITHSGTNVHFFYGADKSRILKVVGSKRTVYVGLGAEGNALYEQETNGSTIKNRHYIYANGSQAVAIHTNEGTTDSMEYLHRDHLGSVEAITDKNGLVSNRMSYDVWGKQRSVDWSDVPLGNYIVNATNLGYTGHESIPEVGYIHMNGRVYDPVVGRFLSADPHVQTETDMQSYNRYSYVQNNPLRYTDPTGYRIGGFLGDLLHDLVSSLHDFMDRNATAIMAAYLAYCTGGASSGWTGAAVSGATSAAATVTMNGGDLEDIMRAAAVGALTGAVFGSINEHFGDTWNAERVAVTSVAGGITAEFSGGNFEDGFSTAFSTSSARLIYSEISSTPNSTTGKPYNPSGKPHLWQEGQNDLGKQNGWKPITDKGSVMKILGKGPYGDAFAEFHDGLHEYLPQDFVSLVFTMPPSYVLTVTAAMQPYTQYIISNDARRKSNF